MMNTAFFLSQNIADIDTSSIEGKLSMGLQVTVLGMLIVFAVLAVLFLCLLLFRLAFHDLPAKIKQKKSVQPATVDVPTETVANDDVIVAVITAAIMASQDETQEARFRVVSFRRIG